MSEQLQQALQNFIVMLVTGILGALAAFTIALVKKGLSWLSEKTQSVKNEISRNQLQEALSLLDTVVVNTVVSLQQTLGDQIKESIASSDGVYDREDLLALKDAALKMINEQLSEAAIEILSGAFDDLPGLISNMVETQVRYLKSSDSGTLLIGEPVDPE